AMSSDRSRPADADLPAADDVPNLARAAVEGLAGLEADGVATGGGAHGDGLVARLGQAGRGADFRAVQPYRRLAAGALAEAVQAHFRRDDDRCPLGLARAALAVQGS